MSTIHFIERYGFPIRTRVNLPKSKWEKEMFDTETAIILGAGASMSYDFPSGRN